MRRNSTGQATNQPASLIIGRHQQRSHAKQQRVYTYVSFIYLIDLIYPYIHTHPISSDPFKTPQMRAQVPRGVNNSLSSNRSFPKTSPVHFLNRSFPEISSTSPVAPSLPSLPFAPSQRRSQGTSPVAPSQKNSSTPPVAPSLKTYIYPCHPHALFPYTVLADLHQSLFPWPVSSPFFSLTHSLFPRLSLLPPSSAAFSVRSSE